MSDRTPGGGRAWVPPGGDVGPPQGPPPPTVWPPSPGAAPGGAPPPIWPPPPGYPQGTGPPGYQRGPTAGDARTGPLPLHPMGLGDILDGAFKLLKANARTVFALTAMFSIPINLLVSYLYRDVEVESTAFTDPTATAGGTATDDAAWVGALVSLLAASVVLPFVSGAVSRVVASSYLGEQLTAGRALRATVRRAWALVWAWVLVHLREFVWFGLAFLVAGVIIAVSGEAPVVVGVAAVGALVVGTVMFLRTMALMVAVAPAIVVEELGPVRAIRRSSRLLRPRKWRVLGVALVSGVLASILGTVVSFVPQLLGALVGEDRGGWLLVAAGGSISQMLTLSLVAIVATLVYFDGRIRQEGFDLQVMASDLARGRPG